MAKSPLQAAVDTWNKRAAEAKAAGIPESAYLELGKRDIAKVKQTGGSVISAGEANAAVMAAAQGHPVVTAKPKASITNFLNPVSWGKDIANIVWGFPAGMARFAYHLPSELETQGKEMLSKDYAAAHIPGYEEPNKPGGGKDIGALLRDLVKEPIAGLLPGLHTAAGMTSPEGRKELQRHPVGTLLDVLPIASAVGKAAVAGKVSELAASAEVPSKLADEGATLKQVARAKRTAGIESMTPVEQALAKGNPLKAGFRTLAGKTPEGLPRTSEFLRTTARRMGIDAEGRSAAAAGDTATNQLMNEYNAYQTELYKTQPWLKGLSPEEDQALSEAASNFNRDEYNARINAAKDTIRTGTTEQKAAATEALAHLEDQYAKIEVIRGHQEHFAKLQMASKDNPDGLHYLEGEIKGQKYGGVYANGSAPVRAHKVMVRVQENLGAARDALQRKTDAGATPGQIKAAEARVKRWETKAVKSSEKFHKSLAKHAPEAFKPLQQRLFKERVAEAVTSSGVHEEQLAKAMSEIEHSGTFTELQSLVDKPTWNKIWKDTVEGWTDLVRQGYDPVYLPMTKVSTLSELEHPQAISLSELNKPTAYRKTVFNFEPRLGGVTVGIAKTAMDYLSSKAQDLHFAEHVKPYTKTREELVTEYTQRLEKSIDDPRVNKRLEAEHLVDQEHRLLPSQWGKRYGDKLMAPTHMVKAWESLFGRETNIPLTANPIARGGMRIFRVSVLTGPRHIVHVAVGGTVMAMGEHPIEFFRHYGQARQIVKDGIMDPAHNLHLDVITPDQAFHFAGGKTMARLLNSAGKPLEHYAKFEETIANQQRVMVQLAGEAKGLPRDEAIMQANRVLVDVKSMSPMERAIAKQLIPFYPFMRHLFRYLFTYPVDHPYRAAVISNFAEMEMADQKSGLPTLFHQLFFLGKPDSKGNVATVDFKAINPFRSFYNDFSLAGFISGLNPFISAAITASGTNILSATPELHPQLEIDPLTGKLRGKPKTGVAQSFLQSFIPESQAVDHFFSWTDKTRYLKQNNPEAYRRQLFSALNLPFDFGTTNVPFERAQAERERYKFAQQQVSQAMQTGKAGPLEGLDTVPYPGQGLVHASQIAQMLKEIQAPKGVSPKAIMRPLKKKKKTGVF